MEKLTETDIKKIEQLNIELSSIEEKIYHLAKLQNQIALKKILEKENNITDYELEVNIFFSTDRDGKIVTWNEQMKAHFLLDIYHNINDKKNYAVPKVIINSKELKFEKCCWLMYKLYIDCDLKWIDMLLISNILFDINISYQYQININL